jgi:unconventional prefoldin RPB5 interactor 1
LNLSEPVRDYIVEHQPSTVSTEAAQSAGQAKPRKPSKFKAARDAVPQTLYPPSPSTLPPISDPEPTGPLNKTHADSIIERATTTKPNAPTPDDFDDAMHRQEIAGEYYKIRNRMIQRQGGFVGEGAAENYGEEITPLPMVDEDGKERKISRFKAARLK